MSITAISYGIAAFVYLVFMAVLFTDRRRGKNKLLLLAAVAASCVWSLAVAIESFADSYPVYLDYLAFLKNLSWIVFVSYMLMSFRPDNAGLRIGFRRVFRSLAIIIAAIVLLLLFFINFEVAPAQDVLFVSIHLLMAIAGIVVIEQFYRNVSSEQRWVIKYLCIGLLGAFLYEFYMYSDAMLYQRVDGVLWDTRGFVNALLVPLIAYSVLRDPLWNPEIFVSRRVVFHTTTLLASAVYLFIMGAAGYYVKQYGGEWGAVVQALLLFATIMVLALFLSSRRIRAKVRVFLNKHFYPYKYDYRDEWLRLIRTISSSTARLYNESIRAIAQIIESPAGFLWINTGHGFYECTTGLNKQIIDDKLPTRSSLSRFMRDHEFIINADEFRENPEVYLRLDELELPSWVDETDTWLIVPLIHIDSLIGFIALDHAPDRNKEFNWEDGDLLKTAARQVASYISQQKISAALAEAKQFERFNKISTYIVHDMKNLVTQLSLIVANADKHKNNPLFMRDAMDTIDNTVSKMNKMLEVVSGSTSASKNSRFELVALLAELVDMRKQSGHHPLPQLDCDSTEVYVRADREQLSSIFGHLLQNAQEATPDEGEVRIEQVLADDGDIEIRFIDTGCGMSEGFIRDKLFAPFKSTKGKGMGIGVYETREIITALGGTIEVSSVVGEGSIFTVRLPRAEDS